MLRLRLAVLTAVVVSCGCASMKQGHTQPVAVHTTIYLPVTAPTTTHTSSCVFPTSAQEKVVVPPPAHFGIELK